MHILNDKYDTHLWMKIHFNSISTAEICYNRNINNWNTYTTTLQIMSCVQNHAQKSHLNSQNDPWSLNQSRMKLNIKG